MSETNFTFQHFTLAINAVSISAVNAQWQFFDSNNPNTLIKEESGTYDILLQPENKFIDIENSPSRVKSFYNYYGYLSLTKSDNAAKIIVPCNRILVLNIVERDIELTIIPHYISKVTGIAEEIQYTFTKLKITAGASDLTPLILELFKILFIENKYLKPRCPVCQSLGTIYQDTPKEGVLKTDNIICSDCTIGAINLYFYILQQMDFNKPTNELLILIQNLLGFVDNGINLISSLKDILLLNEFYILKAIILTKNTENKNAAKEAEEYIEKVIEYSRSTNNEPLFEKSLPLLSLLNPEKANLLVANQISKESTTPAAPKPSESDGVKEDKPVAPIAPKPVTVPPAAPKPSESDGVKEDKPVAPIVPKPVTVPPTSPKTVLQEEFKTKEASTSDDLDFQIPVAPKKPTKNKLLEFSGLKLEDAISEAEKSASVKEHEVQKPKPPTPTSEDLKAKEKDEEIKEEKVGKKKIKAAFDTSEILGQFEKLEEEKKENEKLYKQSHLELANAAEKPDTGLTFIPPDQIPLDDLDDFGLDSQDSEQELENESSLPEIEEINKIPVDNKEALIAKGFALIESAQKAFEQERYKDTITLVQEGGRILIEHEQWGEEDIQRMMEFINIVKEKLDVQEQENKLKATISLPKGTQASSIKEEAGQDSKNKFLFKPKQASSEFFSTVITKKEEKKKDAGLFASAGSKKSGSEGFSFTPKEEKKKEEKKKGKK